MAKPSDLERAIASFRAELASLEEPATRAVIEAYAPVRRTLIARIGELANVLDTKGELTLSETMRLERATALLSQTEAELLTLGRQLAPLITEAQSQAVALAGEHALGLALVQALGTPAFATIEQTWNRINPQALETLIGRLGDGRSLDQYFDDLAPAVRTVLEDELKRAVVLGTNPRAVAKRLESITDLAGARLLTMARTELLGAYRSASLANYAANSDVLDGWTWICALSPLTCAACLSLSGKRFPLSVTFMPSHARCRCSPVPSVKGSPHLPEDAGKRYVDSLSHVQQDRLFRGSAGGDAYRSGALRLEDFRSLDHSDRWGDSYRQSSLAEAQAAAAKRGGKKSPTPKKATPPKLPPPPPSTFAYDEAGFKAYAGRQFLDWENAASIDEAHAIRFYKGDGYSQINDSLRHGTMRDQPIIAKQIKTIDSGLSKAVIEQDAIVYRGVRSVGHLAEWSGLRPGSVITDKGFVSTTFHQDVARTFGGSGKGDFVIETRVPKGSRGLFIDPLAEFSENRNEGEMLLPRGARMIVTDIKQEDNGSYYVKTTLVMDQRRAQA